MTGAGRLERRRLARDEGGTTGMVRPGGLPVIRKRLCSWCPEMLLVSETPESVILSPSAEEHLRGHGWPQL